MAISPNAASPAMIAAFPTEAAARARTALAQPQGQDHARREQADHQAARVAGQHPQLVADLAASILVMMSSR